MTLAIIYGTRPEALKLGPVAAELRARDADFRVLCTGQHDSLLAGTPAESDLAFGESLALRSDGNVTKWTHEAMRRIAVWLRDTTPDGVVVQGDTMSAYAAAKAAEAEGIPVAHVEAGIRSHNDMEPWPEERMRRAISQTATLHFAPTTFALANLRAEGARGPIHVTGNSIVSALARYTDAKPSAAKPHVVVTLHRRELKQREDFRAILRALLEAMAAETAIRWVWPVHPGLNMQGFARPPNVVFAEPMPYRVFVNLVSEATAVLTDSGGLQEEAATLGVPAVVFRGVTDRPEAVEAGIACVVPPAPQNAASAVRACVDGRVVRLAAPVFGDVLSAGRIADLLMEWEP